MINKLVPILIVSAYSCQPKIVNPLTEKSERVRFVAQKTHFIDTVFLQLPGINNEKSYKGAFWASELMLRTSDQAKENLKYALTHFSIYSEDFNRSIFQQFFPESWKNYTPKNMSFYAGKAGRSEIIIK